MKLPKYVWFGEIGSCAMELERQEDMAFSDRRNNSEYHRHAGVWSTEFEVRNDGTLWSCGWHGDMDYLNNKQLFECTEEEWREDNGYYAPGTHLHEPCPDCDSKMEELYSGIKCTSCDYWFYY